MPLMFSITICAPDGWPRLKHVRENSKKNKHGISKSITSSLLNLTGVGEGGDKKSSTVEKRLLLNSLLSIFS